MSSACKLDKNRDIIAGTRRQRPDLPDRPGREDVGRSSRRRSRKSGPWPSTWTGTSTPRPAERRRAGGKRTCLPFPRPPGMPRSRSRSSRPRRRRRARLRRSPRPSRKPKSRRSARRRSAKAGRFSAISSDGLAKRLWCSPEEMIYSLFWNESGQARRLRDGAEGTALHLGPGRERDARHPIRLRAGVRARSRRRADLSPGQQSLRALDPQSRICARAESTPDRSWTPG